MPFILLSKVTLQDAFRFCDDIAVRSIFIWYSITSSVSLLMLSISPLLWENDLKARVIRIENTIDKFNILCIKRLHMFIFLNYSTNLRLNQRRSKRAHVFCGYVKEQVHDVCGRSAEDDLDSGCVYW